MKLFRVHVHVLISDFCPPLDDRMNKPVKGPGQINTSAQDSSLNRRSFRQTSRPILTKKRSFFEDQTSLTAGSYSSTSSYGSLNDEEAFTRHPES